MVTENDDYIIYNFTMKLQEEYYNFNYECHQLKFNTSIELNDVPCVIINIKSFLLVLP